MKIGLVGDTDGYVYHLLAMLVTWQRHSGQRLDRVIQLSAT